MPIPSCHPLRSALPILAVLAALALAACGDDSDSGNDLGPDPATLAPADSALYFEAVVRPEGEQEEDLLAALGKLLDTDDPAGMIREAVESGAEDEGFSYSDDVEPWLGQRAGAFLSDFSGSDGEGAAVLTVTDEDAANDAIMKAAGADETPEEEATHEGVTYMVDGEGTAVGIVGDFLVAGTEDGMKAAIDASTSESLAENSEASDALDSAPSESLFRTYADVARLVDFAVAAGELSERDLQGAQEQIDQLGEAPVVLSGAASADELSIELSGAAGGETETTDIVSTLPGDAWLALGAPMVGEAIATGYDNLLQSLQSNLDQLRGSGLPDGGLPGGRLPDVRGQIEDALGLDLGRDFSWAGDLGAFVQGSSLLGLGGGVVIETDDENAAVETLEKLRRALQRQPDLQISETADGFQVSAGPAGAELVVRDGKVVIGAAGTSVDDVLAPSETLGDAEGFSSAASALGDELTAGLYLDFPTLVALIESSGQTGDPEYQAAKPYLDAISYVIAGSGTVEDRSVGRFVLGVQEGGSSEAPAASIAP